jgi:invasion protein IalB
MTAIRPFVPRPFPGSLLALLSLAAGVGPALVSPALGEGTIVAGKFNSWTLHVNEGKSHKICFVTSEPTGREPAATARAAALFYVSSWPKDGIKSEVSVKLGFTIKPGSEVKVGVDKESFKLFPKDERAFVADTTQELKLVEAMKKGTKLTVQATGDRGSAVTDTYSLSGFSQALQALASSCP